MSSALSCPNNSNRLTQPQLLIDDRGDVLGQRIKRTMVPCRGTEAAPEGGIKSSPGKEDWRMSPGKKGNLLPAKKSIPWKLPTPRTLDTGLKKKKKKNPSRTTYGKKQTLTTV